MTNGVNLRIIPAAAAAALTLAFAPAAHANPAPLPDGLSVCNTASQNWQDGDLSVKNDPQGYVHYKDELRPKKENGAGLYNAAMHSHALAVCGDPAPVVEPPADGGSEGNPGDNGAGDGTGGGWSGTGI